MQDRLIDEHACAVLALTTPLVWAQDCPPLIPRGVVRRMLDTGALCGLVLRDGTGVEERWLERARGLLVRVSDVYDQIEAYKRDGYRLLFPGREGWPHALGALGQQAPLFLFAKGNAALLDGERIAVAGSRCILRETQRAAEETGRMAARESMTIVTGGAVGADGAAQRGALESGGGAVIVPALPAAQLLKSRLLGKALDAGKLLMLCDALPDEPFSAAKALGRNHTIYALGNASLVVASRKETGGSWRGASDCLRGGWSPVYVWDGENADTVGNRALQKLGAGTYSLDVGLKQQIAMSEQMSLFA